MIIGIGTDLLDVRRVQNALSRHGEAFLSKICSPIEQLDYFEVSVAHRAHFLAKRFAAKEAAAKALGTGFRLGVCYQDIRVVHDALGRPELQFQGGAEQVLAKNGQVQAHLTLSDEVDYVVAHVVLEKL